MILKQRINNASLTDLASDFENLFEQVFGEPGQPQNTWTPRANVLENDSSYLVEIELPGLSADDVAVELKEGRLSVSGEKTSVENDMTVLKSETRNGKFSRSFKFPAQLSADKISANFKNGMLSVELPKSEAVLSRKIEIGTQD